MRKNWLLGAGMLACTIALMAGAFVYGQRKVEVQVQRERPARTVNKATLLIGSTVNIENASVGKVTDIILSEGGCVDYLVVAEEGRNVLVPWAAARVDFVKPTVGIEIQREKWREVPTFTADRWPDLSDARYTERLYTFYGVSPGRERRIDRKEGRRIRP